MDFGEFIMKIIVEYNNKTYEFNDGYYAYIFDYAICNEFDKNMAKINYLNLSIELKSHT